MKEVVENLKYDTVRCSKNSESNIQYTGDRFSKKRIKKIPGKLMPHYIILFPLSGNWAGCF
jgi:hypothetical protein